MPKIILRRGIPGSGKSTWAKKWVEEDPTHRVRWNNDDFRRMLGLYWVPEREHLVSESRLEFLSKAMLFGYNIVIDNMNLNDWNWTVVQAKIDNFNRGVFGKVLKKRYTLEFKDFFDVSLEECIERDSKRENPIGEKVITETYNMYKDIIKKLKVK
nr:MAG TPA: polynucleotide kinase [Caudoviricetes sp.]